MNQVLFGPEVSLRSLNGGVAREHLDLLQLTAARPAQFCAGVAQVVGRDARNTRRRRVGL